MVEPTRRSTRSSTRGLTQTPISDSSKRDNPIKADKIATKSSTRKPTKKGTKKAEPEPELKLDSEPELESSPVVDVVEPDEKHAATEVPPNDSQTTEIADELDPSKQDDNNPIKPKRKSRSNKKVIVDDDDDDDDEYQPDKDDDDKDYEAVEEGVEEEEDEEVSEKEEDGEDDCDFELTEKELKTVNKAFDIHCSNLKEETMASDNLKMALRSLGYEPRAEEIRTLMKRFCTKSSSKSRKKLLNRHGFQKLMAFKYSRSAGFNDDISNDEISKVFNLFDLNKTGKISWQNLKSIAKELNETLTDEELKEMVSEADQDGDNLVDKIEFQNIMKKTSLY